MTGRAAAIQGGLAALGLALAWSTWQRDTSPTTADVVLVDVTRGELERVRFDDNGKWTEFERRKEEGGPAVWLRVGPRTVEPKSPERQIRGNEAATKFWERLAPLRGTRSLGVVDAAKQKELALDTSRKRIVLTARGETRSFVIAMPSGGGDVYARDERDGRVYMLARSLVSDMENAAMRFTERGLHGFKPVDIARATVSAAGKRREFVQPGPQGAMTLRLASARTPDKTDEQVTNWHDHLWRLFPSEVLGKGETPADGEPKVALKIEYAERSGPLGFIELARAVAPTPAVEPAPNSATAPAGPIFYARTEYTAGWVKLPASTADLLSEGERIATTD